MALRSALQGSRVARQSPARTGISARTTTSRCAQRARPLHSAATDAGMALDVAGGVEVASAPRVVDVSSLLAELREESPDFVWTDDAVAAPIWEHEGRFKGKPMTADELAAAQVAPPPAEPAPEAAPEMASAYSAEAGFREMSAPELAAALGGAGAPAAVVDVRTRAEYASGHIPGSTNVPFDELSFAARSGVLDSLRAVPIAVVCESGQRSAQAVVRLTKVLGFDDVSNVAGGMQAWRQHGQAVSEGGSGKAAGGCGGGGGGGGGGGCGCH